MNSLLAHMVLNTVDDLYLTTAETVRVSTLMAFDEGGLLACANETEYGIYRPLQSLPGTAYVDHGPKFDIVMGLAPTTDKRYYGLVPLSTVTHIMHHLGRGLNLPARGVHTHALATATPGWVALAASLMQTKPAGLTGVLIPRSDLKHLDSPQLWQLLTRTAALREVVLAGLHVLLVFQRHPSQGTGARVKIWTPCRQHDHSPGVLHSPDLTALQAVAA